MNNKGQSLVLFVLIVPVIFLIILMVYDIGSMVLLKQELDDINYLALDYAMDHIGEDNLQDKLNNIIIQNMSDIDNIDISINNDKIYITLEDKINTRISLIKDMDVFIIRSSYVGYIDVDKKVIERNK